MLILGGLIIGGIVIFGSRYASLKSDDQILQEAIWEQSRREDEQQKSAAELIKTVLPTPESCANLKAGFVFDYLDLEPDDLVSWPDWTLHATPAEQTCVLDALHTTNTQAYTLQGREYVIETPSNKSVVRFLDAVGSATLTTEGINYGDPNVPMDLLVGGYFVERTEMRLSAKFAF